MRAPRLVLVRAAGAAFVAVLTGAFAALPTGGCQPSLELKLCGEIPTSGCPIGRGGSCDDATCSGLYDCVEGKWTLEVDCKREGGSSGGAGGGSADAGPDAMCMPVTLAHDGEIQGCKPDLQNPDCPVVAAEAVCRESVCLTGCDDFLLCTKDGWTLVAYCDEEGVLVISP
jgi:hypothetical protein